MTQTQLAHAGDTAPVNQEQQSDGIKLDKASARLQEQSTLQLEGRLMGDSALVHEKQDGPVPMET